MPPLKFVIKCGNHAVLVDLYSLPLGSLVDSWITTEHIEEVTELIRGAVDQRVKLLKETYYWRGLPKHKREPAPAETLSVQGILSTSCCDLHPGPLPTMPTLLGAVNQRHSYHRSPSCPL
ncbi:protein SLX4IP [Hypomesus transpacificus]|uniref:protein SLX4IP n=1 Tax=Hypomesus transpacificus TaxID=137520 RepID=UPI001F074061|nr:protein SLX4IP [Hypomesus transpacificus]